MKASELPTDIRDMLVFKMDSPSQLGPWLRSMRQFDQVGAADVGGVLGIDRRTVLSIERGDYDPRLARAIGLAKAHGCSLYWIRDGIDLA